MKRIAIFGAGAVGSYLGAFMTREGEDVTVIDQWPEHVEAVKANGMNVTGTQGPFNAPMKAVHLHEAQGFGREFDVAFIAVKSYDTLWAATFMERYLKPTGYMVSSQNGINDETIASVVGIRRAIGCVMSNIQVALWTPGETHRGGEFGRDRGHDVFRVGHIDGAVTDAVLRVVELVSSVDGAKATTNLAGERWAKLAANCMGNPVGAMSGLGSHGQADSPEARRLKIYITREVVQVATALGHRVEGISGVSAETWLQTDKGDVLEDLDARLRGKGRVDWHSSMGQDAIKGRRSEIDHLNGLVCRRGAEAGVPTPYNDSVVALMRRVDAGELQQSPDNIARARAAGEAAS